MKNFTDFLILALFLILTSASCKKNSDEPLNAAVSCKIDGRAWQSYSDDFKLSGSRGEVTRNGDRVSMFATNTKTSEKIGITISTPGKTVTEGKYIINSKSFLYGSYYLYDVGQFITGAGYQGEVELISIDKVTSQITGKFQYSCYNENTKKSVIITEGNFKVHYDLTD